MPDENGRTGRFGDCKQCLAANEGDRNEVRARWRCGYMSPDLWRDDGREQDRFPKNLGRFFGREYEGDVCPGWAVTQPAVAEACRAHFWAEKGQLDVVYGDGAPAPIVEAIETLVQAFNLHQNEKLKNR